MNTVLPTVSCTWLVNRGQLWALIWLSQNKPVCLKRPLLSITFEIAGVFTISWRALAWAGQAADLSTEKLSSAGKMFSWPWLTAKAPTPPLPHQDRRKAVPNLQHSDGQNFCNWESATPRQSKTRQNSCDKVSLKILTLPQFFTQETSKKLWPLVPSSSANKNPASEKGQCKSNSSCWTSSPPFHCSYGRCIKKKITVATRLHSKTAHAHPQFCVHRNTEGLGLSSSTVPLCLGGSHINAV